MGIRNLVDISWYETKGEFYGGIEEEICKENVKDLLNQL